MSSRRRQDDRHGHSERPSFWEYNQRGVSFYRRGSYDLAIRELRQAVRASPFPLAALYVNLGAVYLRNGMFGKAVDSLEEGLHTDPDDQAGHTLLGQALLALGEMAAATTEFERARELDPDSPEGRAAEEELHHLREGVLR